MNITHQPIGDLRARHFRQCLACDSTDTNRQGRVLRCRSCETTYLIPAVQLVRVVR